MKTKKVFALLMAGLLALNATGISVLAETEKKMHWTQKMILTVAERK